MATASWRSQSSKQTHSSAQKKSRAYPGPREEHASDGEVQQHGKFTLEAASSDQRGFKERERVIMPNKCDKASGTLMNMCARIAHFSSEHVYEERKPRAGAALGNGHDRVAAAQQGVVMHELA